MRPCTVWRALAHCPSFFRKHETDPLIYVIPSLACLLSFLAVSQVGRSDDWLARTRRNDGRIDRAIDAVKLGRETDKKRHL